MWSPVQSCCRVVATENCRLQKTQFAFCPVVLSRQLCLGELFGLHQPVCPFISTSHPQMDMDMDMGIHVGSKECVGQLF